MFGTPTTSTTTGFSGFGTSNTSGFGSTPSTGFGSTATGFGTTTTGGFGTSTTGGFGSTPSFGSTSTASGFGTGTNFGFTPATTASVFGTSGGFGSTATTTTASSGLGTTTGFNLTPATTTSAFMGFGNNAAKPTTSIFSMPAAKTPSLGGTAQPPKPDLGGEATLPMLYKSVKETPVPPELAKLVEDLGAVIKKTKAEWASPGAGGLRPALGRTAEDAEAVRGALLRVERSAATNARDAAKARKDVTRLGAGCDTAQRTRDLPPGVQPDNAGPLVYFVSLADSFQERVVRLRVEVESTERHMQSALNPVAPQPQDLRDSLRRLHECFVSLAGRMQLAHSGMQALKQAHLDLRRTWTGDYTDIFSHKATKEGASGSTAPLTLDSLYSSAAAVVRGGGDAPALVTSAPLTTPQPALVPPVASPLAVTGSKRGKR